MSEPVSSDLVALLASNVAHDGPTAEFVCFSSHLHYGDIPDPAKEAAHAALSDTLGVAIAGSVSEVGRALAGYVSERGGSGGATVLGCGNAFSPEIAALANGSMAHALDYDDTTYGALAHLSSPLLSSLLAIGETEGKTGRDLITAYVAGFEVGSRVGRAMIPAMVDSGWHTTGVIGAIAAAVACARLLELSESETQMAIGVVASEASGALINLGTRTKPLHAGFAARNGVQAAYLARAGFDAIPNILEVPKGFADLHSGPGNHRLEAVTPDLGQEWHLLTFGNTQKPYPCCAGTHRAIDALLKLLSKEQVDVDRIAAVEVGVWYLGPTTLPYADPRTPLEAKFSMPYVIATALVDRRVGLAHFKPDMLARPEVRRLMPRVHMFVHPDMAKRDAWDTSVKFAEVTITMQDGCTFSGRTYRQKGFPDNPMRPSEQEAKFRECCSEALSEERTLKLQNIVAGLPELDDLRELTCLLG